MLYRRRARSSLRTPRVRPTRSTRRSEPHPQTRCSRDARHAKSPDAIITETPEGKDDDTLHDSWTEPSVPQEDRGKEWTEVRNVVKSGLIKGGSSPTHEVDDADDLAAAAAEKL